MENFECALDSFDLINTVREFPEIYDFSHHKNREKKKAAWIEVCKQLFPQWRKFNNEEKQFCEAEVMKKWRNMRDCFTKEFRRVMTLKKNNMPDTKKSTYVYYKSLDYMLPTALKRFEMESNKSWNNDDEPEKINNSLPAVASTSKNSLQIVESRRSGRCRKLTEKFKERLYDVSIENDVEVDIEIEPPQDTRKTLRPSSISKKKKLTNGKNISRLSTPPTLKTSMKPTKPMHTTKTRDCLKNVLHHLSDELTNGNNQKDADEMFLLSLLPLWKQLDENVKLETKIDILKLLQSKINE